MDKNTLIAHALASEVMDENYRGTLRIKKHRLDIQTQTIWGKIMQATTTLIKKYIFSGGRKYQL